MIKKDTGLDGFILFQKSFTGEVNCALTLFVFFLNGLENNIHCIASKVYFPFNG